MLDALDAVLRIGNYLVVAAAAAVGVRFARRARRHNQLTLHQGDKQDWRTDVRARINRYLRADTGRAERDGLGLRILHRPYQDPSLKPPYFAVSVVEINDLEPRVEDLDSEDVVAQDIIDALIEGLGELGLGHLAVDRDWLLATTLLGGATDTIEQRSGELVAAASLPPSELDQYRFALLRHDPYIVWVYLIDQQTDRRKT